MNENVITIVGICLLIGAMAKSSQVGLHVWLPMAMDNTSRKWSMNSYWLKQ
jgi:NADH-ubiquinone oxidoreductase chain 5